eukprot:734069_1
MTRIARTLILLILISGTPIIHCAQDPNPGNYNNNNNSPSSPKRHDGHFGYNHENHGSFKNLHGAQRQHNDKTDSASSEAPEPDPLLEKNNYAELPDKSVKTFQVADTMINFNGKLKAQVGTPENVSEFSPLPPTANLVELGPGNDNSKEVTTNLLRDSPSQSGRTGSDYSNGSSTPPADTEFNLRYGNDSKIAYANDTNDTELHTSFNDVLKSAYAKSLTPPDSVNMGDSDNSLSSTTDSDKEGRVRDDEEDSDKEGRVRDDEEDSDKEGRVRDDGEDDYKLPEQKEQDVHDINSDYVYMIAKLKLENAEFKEFKTKYEKLKEQRKPPQQIVRFPKYYDFVPKDLPKSLTCYDRSENIVDCESLEWLFAFYPLNKSVQVTDNHAKYPNCLFNANSKDFKGNNKEYLVTLIPQSTVIKKGSVLLRFGDAVNWPMSFHTDPRKQDKLTAFTKSMGTGLFYMDYSSSIFGHDNIKCFVRLAKY